MNILKDEAFERCLTAIDERLSIELATQKFILASNFPLIAKQCGLVAFRDYADSVALFLEKYLTKYTLLKNVTIEGKTYPGVIVKKDNLPYSITTIHPAMARHTRQWQKHKRQWQNKMGAFVSNSCLAPPKKPVIKPIAGFFSMCFSINKWSEHTAVSTKVS